MPTEGPFIPGLKAKEARPARVFLKVFPELDENMSFLTENYAKLRASWTATHFSAQTAGTRGSIGRFAQRRASLSKRMRNTWKRSELRRADRDRGAEKRRSVCPNPECGKLVEAKEDF